MKTKQTLLSSAVLLACSSVYTQAYATLPVDPVLNFDAGVTTCTYHGTCFVKSGSYFGMDTNGSGSVTPNERTALVINDGLKIGTIQTASGSHSGAPDGTETEGVGKAWAFFGNTGLHYTSVSSAILSDDNAGYATINMSGWTVAWNGIPAIPMITTAWESYSEGAGAATPGVNPDGVGVLRCGSACADGDTFTLQYSATVPLGDPSGFGGVKYNIYYLGTIGTFNTPPVTTDLGSSVSSLGGTTVISLTGNVTDTDIGDSISSTNIDNTSVVITNPSANIATNCTPTSVANNSDGTVTFPVCSNATYTFDFTFADGFETSNTSTVTVTVSGDPAPNALDDTATTDGVTPVEIFVLTNDNDNNIDTTSVAIVGAPSNGGATVTGSGATITYTANAGFVGTDTFTYSVDDLSPQTSNTATVTVTVNALNVPVSSDTYAVGTTAAAAGSTTGIITIGQIGVEDTGSFPEDDIAQSCIGGCFDFTLTGMGAGNSSSVVLPLSIPIPEKADAGNTITYRKLVNGNWQNFDTTTDSFQSAPGTVNGSNVSCPPATSPDYVGLTTGHNCLLLNITDGGPNDADGLADGTITDPGGLAEITRVSGTDGCSMTGVNRSANNHADWWLVSAFIGLLGWFSLKRKQA